MLPQNQLKSSTKTKTVKQKVNIVKYRWFTKEAGTRDSGFCDYWKTCLTTNWRMVRAMMSLFPLILNVSRITNKACINWTDRKQRL